MRRQYQEIADHIMTQIGFMVRHVGTCVVERSTQQILDVLIFSNHSTNLSILEA